MMGGGVNGNRRTVAQYLEAGNFFDPQIRAGVSSGWLQSMHGSAHGLAGFAFSRAFDEGKHWTSLAI
jgi:hypothetical protein